MAGITLLQAQTQLDQHIAALTAATSAQRYKIADRELQRASLETIQAGVTFWDNQVKLLTRQSQGRSRGRTVVAG